MRFPKNRYGFGILEVLIAGVLLSCILLAIPKMLDITMRGSKSVSQGGEYADLLNIVRLATQNENFCKCNFAKVNSAAITFASSQTATFEQPLTEIKSYNDTCAAGPTLLTKSATGQNGQNIWVNDLKLKSFSRLSDTEYMAKLHVEVSKAQKTLGGPGYTKDFDMLYSTTTAADGTVTLNDCALNRSLASGSSSGTPGLYIGDFWGIHFNTNNQTELYTVPSGKTLMITRIRGSNIRLNGAGLDLASNWNSTVPLVDETLFMKEGEILTFTGNADEDVSGLLIDSSVRAGGTYWSVQLTNIIPTTTYTVPANKTLIMTHMHSCFNCYCSINGIGVWGNSPGLQATSHPFTFKSGQTLTLTAPNCRFHGYILDTP